jgi:type IV secretion system protein VirB6
MIKFFKPLVLVLILITINSTYADFGKSCSMIDKSVVSDEVMNHLSKDSMYGVVKNLFDIENCGPEYSRGCSSTDNSKIFVCVKKTSAPASFAKADNSNMIELQSLEPVRLGNLTTLEMVTQDDNLANIIITAGLIGDKLCIVMPTTYGYVPLACRGTSLSSNVNVKLPDRSECSEISTGCSLYGNPLNISRAQNNFFGNAVQCVFESLDIIFFDPRTCGSDQIDLLKDFSRIETKVKPFAEFYKTLQNIVMAAITLYIIVFGIKTALNPEDFSINEAFLSVVKILMVIYFSVGTTALDWFSGKQKSSNGITEVVLPFMIDFSTGMSSYIFNNSSSNLLCYFSPDEYDKKYSYYALWDSMDCRMNTYLGISKVFYERQELAKYRRVAIPGEPASNVPDLDFSWGDKPDGLKPASGDSEAMRYSKAIGFFLTISSMLLTGGFMPFFILLFVMLTIVGMMFSFLMSFMVSLVLMYILAYIAPIFVPMSLFERTKGYFDAWLNLCMSTALQPVIILAFAAFILNLIDSFMFDQCIFAKYVDTDAIFELRLPLDQSGIEACKGSIGYKLFQYYQLKNGWQEQTYLFFSITSLKDVYDLEGSCWTGLIMCFFLKYLLEQVYALSSSLSNGMSLDAVVSSPMAVINSIRSTASKMYSGGKGLAKMVKEAKQGQGDSVKAPTGGGGS